MNIALNQNEVVNLLRDIKHALTYNQTDYVYSPEASRIMAVSERDLKILSEQFGLPRYKRGKPYVYKKVDCYKFASLIDNGTIVIPTK